LGLLTTRTGEKDRLAITISTTERNYRMTIIQFGLAYNMYLREDSIRQQFCCFNDPVRCNPNDNLRYQ